MPETLEPPVANPVLPATFTPPAPTSNDAPPSPEVAEKEREGGLSRLFAIDRTAEDKPVEVERPKEPEAPKVAPEPEKTVPEPAKPADALKPVEVPKAPEQGKATPKADEAKLPDSLTDGVPETQPGNHREAARAFNLMRKRLAQADAERKAQAEELKKAKETAVAPPDYEELKGRAARLEQDRQEMEDRLKEREERLYATNLRERPEYKDYVDKPKAQLKDFGGKLMAKYNLRYRDFTDAMEMEPEQRDAILAEHLEGMNKLDEGHYRAMIDSWNQVRQNETILEAKSKEKLDEFKANDEKRDAAKKDGDVRAMIAAQAAHRDKRTAAMPFVFKPEGDEPETVQYRDGLDKIRERASQVVRAGGMTVLKPETQAMMIEDAMTADYVIRGMGNVVQSRDARIKELEAQATEREAAFKTLESELAEYRGGVPGGEEGAATGSNGLADDAPLEARLGRFSRLWER